MSFASILGRLLLVIPVVAWAQPVEKTARIEISGETSQPVEFQVTDVSNNGKSSVSAWAQTEEARKRIFSVTFAASDEWQEGSFTITPLQSGRISITLLGPYVAAYDGAKELVPILIDYDNVSSDQVLVRNGSFESVLSGNRVNDWFQGDNPNSNPPLDESLKARAETGETPDGANFARVWHNSSLSQVLDVTQGQPVTIHLFYRLGL